MARARGLILDRDGVINVDVGYLHRIEDCVFVDGIFELLPRFQALGFRLAIATNQTGIGRGLFGEADFECLMGWMLARLGERGITIDRVYHCPDHPTEGLGRYRRATDRRKPGPGMVLEAIRELDLDPAASWAIGDRERDMAASRAAGIGHLVLLNSAAAPGVRPDGVTVVGRLDEIAPLLSAEEERRRGPAHSCARAE